MTLHTKYSQKSLLDLTHIQTIYLVLISTADHVCQKKYSMFKMWCMNQWRQINFKVMQALSKKAVSVTVGTTTSSSQYDSTVPSREGFFKPSVKDGSGVALQLFVSSHVCCRAFSLRIFFGVAKYRTVSIYFIQI